MRRTFAHARWWWLVVVIVGSSTVAWAADDKGKKPAKKNEGRSLSFGQAVIHLGDAHLLKFGPTLKRLLLKLARCGFTCRAEMALLGEPEHAGGQRHQHQDQRKIPQPVAQPPAAQIQGQQRVQHCGESRHH